MVDKDYNDPKKRLQEMSAIRIYEDKRIERIDAIEKKVDICMSKLDIVIRMLSAIGYQIDKVKKAKWHNNTKPLYTRTDRTVCKGVDMDGYRNNKIWCNPYRWYCICLPDRCYHQRWCIIWRQLKYTMYTQK